MNRPVAKKQAGFTIIELMIATVVFSIILLIVTISILQFSKQYYKGMVASSTQNTARTLIDDITRAIQFNGGNVSVLSNGFCVGSAKRYSYALNQQVVDTNPDTSKHQGRHGLVSDSVTGCNAGTAALDLATLGALTTPNARELLGENMRLTKFSIADNGGNYNITVRVVYGDDDLLANATDPDTNCKGGIGSHFCATSELSTTVRKRTQ